MIKGAKIFFVTLTILIFLPAFIEAKEVGLVVHLKGKATILREASSFKASIKDGIQVADTAETAEQSRLKMLFDDDSLFTLSANSRLIVKEYYYSDDKGRFKSVLQLIDGRMRSLVGKTDLEIHTTTSIVAARGTYFIVWMDIENGSPVTNIAVLDGIVEVFNINPAIVGVVTIEPGTMSRVFKNRPPTPPAPVSRQGEVLKGIGQEIPVIPPIEGQQPTDTTPVHIRIPIP